MVVYHEPRAHFSPETIITGELRKYELATVIEGVNMCPPDKFEIVIKYISVREFS